MPDAVLTRDGPVAVPLDYTVPQAGELLPLMVRATMDGTSAANAYYAVVEVIAPSGRIMGKARSDQIAAGASADVTWFPRVGGSTSSGTSTLPINPALSGNVILPLAVLLGTRATQPSPATFSGNLHTHLGMRITITRTGTLSDLTIYVGNASGSCELAILDTTAANRNVVYSSGLVNIPTSHTYQVIGNPGLSVNAGDQYDFVFGTTDTTLTVMWMGGLVDTTTEGPSGQLPANFLPTAGGAPPKICWADTVTAIPYAVSTVAEALLVPNQNVPLLWARIA